MKKLISACIVLLVVIGFSFKPAGVTPEKITICHLPPGNPGNCQEITISVSAFETHMDHHDDALVCYNQDEFEFYQTLSTTYKMKLVMAYDGITN